MNNSDSLNDVVKLFGISSWEILLQLFGCLVFSLLLCLKVDDILNVSWWYIFIPLFAADAFNLYFSVIVYIRFLALKRAKEANRREFWILLTLSLLFTFKMLLCNKLEGTLQLSNAQVLSPLFALWCLYFVRACRVK